MSYDSPEYIGVNMKAVKPKRNGFLTTVLGTLLSIVAAVVFTLIMTGISRLVFSLRFPDRAVLSLLTNSVTYIIIAFFAYEIVFFVWLFNSMSDEKKSKQGIVSQPPEKASRLGRPVMIAGLVALIISLGMIFANCTVYTEISEDAIIEHTPFTEKEYSLDDAFRYSLVCDANGRLEFFIWMEDGTSFELFNSANTRSDEFVNTYGDGLLHFAGILSDRLDNNEKYVEKVISESTLTYLERYYSQGDSVWEDILKIIE